MVLQPTKNKTMIHQSANVTTQGFHTESPTRPGVSGQSGNSSHSPHSAHSKRRTKAPTVKMTTHLKMKAKPVGHSGDSEDPAVQMGTDALSVNTTTMDVSYIPDGVNMTEWAKHIRGNAQEAFSHCVSKGPELLVIWMLIGLLLGFIVGKCCCRSKGAGQEYQRVSKLEH